MTLRNQNDPAKMPASLQRRLSLYSLAATAAGVELLAIAPSAAAEVVYTPAHNIIQQDKQLAIDLNHDGIIDFTIQNIRKYSTSYKAARLQMVANAANAVGSSHHSFVKPLSRGAVIGPVSPFQGGDELMALQQKIDSEGTYSFGNWFQTSDLYVGFKFKIDGATHYGWARISTQFNSPFRLLAELTGYAYETDADKPISAGNTGKLARDSTLGELALGAVGLPISR